MVLNRMKKDECCICTENLINEDDTYLYGLGCGHIFHKLCIQQVKPVLYRRTDEVMVNGNFCPICRNT